MCRIPGARYQTATPATGARYTGRKEALAVVVGSPHLSPPTRYIGERVEAFRPGLKWNEGAHHAHVVYRGNGTYFFSGVAARRLPGTRPDPDQQGHLAQGRCP